MRGGGLDHRHWLPDRLTDEAGINQLVVGCFETSMHQKSLLVPSAK